MGISSINLTSTGSRSVRAARAGISSSLNPPMSTQLSFSGDRPASLAAWMPASASSRRPPRVIRQYFSGSRVSRLIFTRSTPAAFSSAAISGSRSPLVVRVSSCKRGMRRSSRHRDRTPRLTSGSPPVRRIFLTPSSTAARAISPISSRERI